MRILLVTLMSLGCTVAMGGTVYKWVDENGVTHYSDQPHENAQKVQLKAPQTYTSPKTPAPSPIQSNRYPASNPAPVYQSCAISAPTNDQVFVNTYEVTAGVLVQPSVRPGDTAVVTLDGQTVPGVPASGGQFTISPVDRGTHSIQMEVKDSTGATVCSSATVTFHVQQPSLQSPTRPIKPH
jgi:Domain of unknown function (DUF4124)